VDHSFGKHENGMLGICPARNPSALLCACIAIFLLWLQSSWNIQEKQFAILNEDFNFIPQLQYFLQVKLRTNEEGRWLATP
jgi:molybdopterin molybdotransferase